MNPQLRFDRQHLALVAPQQAPAKLVNESVVAPAQQARVGKGRLTAIDQVDEVVAVAPVGWSIAAGEPAPSVANDQRSTQRGRDGASAPADSMPLTGRVRPGLRKAARSPADTPARTSAATPGPPTPRPRAPLHPKGQTPRSVCPPRCSGPCPSSTPRQ
jgi:hypothetical protein